MSSKTNQCCLIRPYLGRQRVMHGPQNSGRPRFFSLRNFPLHLDQMRDLGLQDATIGCYVTSMAEALATMHWIAKTSAADVEFFLGSSRLALKEHGTGSRSEEIDLGVQDSEVGTLADSALEDHTLWLLDFDVCRHMEFNEHGVREAIRAFIRNDPFYPRPGLPFWREFREAYLVASRIIFSHADDESAINLPATFIDGVELDLER